MLLLGARRKNNSVFGDLFAGRRKSKLQFGDNSELRREKLREFASWEKKLLYITTKK